MRNMNSNRSRGFAFLAAAALAVLTMGCANTAPPAPAKVAAFDDGAQLWAQNCIRCHNTRSPDMYSDAQWEVAVLHMRARANLTAHEHKAIVAFLKSAH